MEYHTWIWGQQPKPEGAWKPGLVPQDCGRDIPCLRTAHGSSCQSPAVGSSQLPSPFSLTPVWGWGASAQLVPVELLGSGICRTFHRSVQQRSSCCVAAVAAAAAVALQHADEQRLSPADLCAQLPGLDQSHQTGVVEGVLHMLSWPVSHKHPWKVQPQLGNPLCLWHKGRGMLPADSDMPQAGRKYPGRFHPATDRCGHEPFLIPIPEQTTHSPPETSVPRTATPQPRRMAGCATSP